MIPEMVAVGSGSKVFRVRGWLKDLGGRFDSNRRVWLVPSEQLFEARRIIENGGPFQGSTIEPLLDVDGEWSEDDLLMPTVPPDPSPIGPAELVLICRKALTFIADDLRHGSWNESEASLFEYAQSRLLVDGHDVSWLRKSYQVLRRKWKDRLECQESRSLQKIEANHL